MKRPLCLMLCFSLLLLIAGCGFKVERPDLYTVALNSMLWIRGASYQSDFDGPPHIEVLETDSYGRVLFSYREKSWHSASLASLLIMQRSDEGYVYFYPDMNFISIPSTTNMQEPVAFAEEDIFALKQKNDWEQEIDLQKCVKKEITDRSESFEAYYEDCKASETKQKLIEAIRKYDSSDNLDWYFYKGMQDAYGRTLFYGEIDHQSMAILFDADMNCDLDTCFFIPDDFYNYQDEFRTFKERNRWNQPLE